MGDVSTESTYRCPHCGEVLDHVVVTGKAPLGALLADRRRNYNKLTAEQLQRVAELRRTDGVQAVADEFGVSYRQADRYAVRARKAGLL